MFGNSGFSDLLRLLGANRVRYMVIGGYALIQYTEPRYTRDLELWISTDAVNARAVYKTLMELGAPLDKLTEADFSQDGFYYQMGVPPVRVDIFMGIPGVEFEDAWQRRQEVDYDGLPVCFISREDLIRAKLAAGRPQDLMDMESLSRSSKPQADRQET